MGNLIINDNTFLRQFEVEIDEDLAKIEYALQDRKIFLTKLIIPYSNSNPDFEETFIREVFEIIKEKNIRIMPTSPEIRKFIKKHKQFNDLTRIASIYSEREETWRRKFTFLLPRFIPTLCNTLHHIYPNFNRFQFGYS